MRTGDLLNEAADLRKEGESYALTACLIKLIVKIIELEQQVYVLSMPPAERQALRKAGERFARKSMKGGRKRWI